MSEKRFSELPPAQPLKDSDIFAVTQSVLGTLTSGQVTLEALRAVMATPIIYVEAGSSLDVLNAPSGFYIFELGSTLLNGPGDVKVKSMRHARLEVIVPGRVARLSAWCHFDQSSGYMHGGAWELFVKSDSDVSTFWSFLGPGGSSNPQAYQTWVMQKESLVWTDKEVT